MKKYIFMAVLAILAACDGFPSTPAPDIIRNHKVQIQNYTNQTITSFFASNIDKQDRGNDWFANRVLKNTQNVYLDITDGSGQCFFDFIAVLADGTEITEQDVNVCSIRAWRAE